MAHMPCSTFSQNLSSFCTILLNNKQILMKTTTLAEVTNSNLHPNPLHFKNVFLLMLTLDPQL